MSAQETQDLWFRPIHSLPDFSSSYNYWIYHDSEGFVWISSTAGLNRFDGTKVKHYSSVLGDSTTMADDNIQSNFYEDSQGNLWFSTATAINCYRRATDDFLQIPSVSLPCQPLNNYVFFLEKDTFLWYATQEGVYRYNIHSGFDAKQVLEATNPWFAVDTTANGNVHYLYGKTALENCEYFYWEINDGEVVKWKNWFDEPDPKLLPKSINSIWTDANNVSWVGTDKGLVKWDRDSSSWELLEENNYSDCWLTPWKEGRLIGWSWENGLFVYDKKNISFTPINVNNLGETDLTYQKLFDLYVDKEENLWISFYSSGFMQANLQKTKFKSIPKIKSVEGKKTDYSYWSFFEGEDESLWHGSSTEGLFELDGQGELLHHYMPDTTNAYSLPYQWVTCFENGMNGGIYIGTRRGVVYLRPDSNPRQFQYLEAKNDTAVIDVSNLIRIKNNVLVSTEENGIYRIEENGTMPILVNIWNSGNNYSKMHCDSKGRLFIGRNEEDIEVFNFDDEGILQPVNTLPVAKYITGFWEDKEKNILWVASFSGLVKVDLGNMEVMQIFTEKDGLPTKNIHSILGDDFHNLWLSTPQGLVRFNENEGFHTYSLADGTLSTEFYIHSAIKRRNGDLWFGGTNGITIVPASEIPLDIETRPKIKLTGLGINEEGQPLEVLQQEELSLRYWENTLAFEFVAMEYSDPSNIQLFYKLENADDDWVQLPKGNYGNPRYPDLRYGNKYTLKVRALNSDGVLEAEANEKLMTIFIDRPWYLKWWAILSYILLLVAILYAYYRYRIALIRKEENYKRQLAELRQKEAEAKQQVAETETAILRLQMNPHFIFNSMNSINSYILKKDIDTASGYLNRFSRLMRMILDLAANPYVSIYEEKELLELYIQTEAMRFEEKFSYEIKVDAALDPDDTILPTMILQPFVENAIWHGISGKGIKGHIKVHFQQFNDSLICSVEDNGRGREATKIKDGEKGHVSKALSITKHRLKLLENETGKPAHFKIIDLKEDSGEAVGTKVILTLPLL